MARRLSLQILDALTRVERRQRHTLRRLAAIEQALNVNTVNDILTRETLMGTKEDLLAAVAANTEIDQSIVAALDANTEMLREALENQGVDGAVIDQVIAELQASNSDVADAVVRNTIADPGTDEIPGGNVPDDGTTVPPVDQPTDSTDEGNPT